MLAVAGVTVFLWYYAGRDVVIVSPTFAFALVALALAVMFAAIDGMKSRQHRAAIAFRKALAAARAFFLAELGKEQPALRDEWVPCDPGVWTRQADGRLVRPPPGRHWPHRLVRVHILFKLGVVAGPLDRLQRRAFGRRRRRRLLGSGRKRPGSRRLSSEFKRVERWRQRQQQFQQRRIVRGRWRRRLVMRSARFRRVSRARRFPKPAQRSEIPDVERIGHHRMRPPAVMRLLRLNQDRQAVEARSCNSRRNGSRPETAVADVLVTVDAAAARPLRVVTVKDAQPVEPDDTIERVEGAVVTAVASTMS